MNFWSVSRHFPVIFQRPFLSFFLTIFVGHFWPFRYRFYFLVISKNWIFDDLKWNILPEFFFILPLTEFSHISLTVKSTSECSFDLWNFYEFRGNFMNFKKMTIFCWFEWIILGSTVTVLKHLVSGSSVKVSTDTNFLLENDSRTGSEFKVLFWENNIFPRPLYIFNFYSHVSKLKIPRTWNWLEYP